MRRAIQRKRRNKKPVRTSARRREPIDIQRCGTLLHAGIIQIEAQTVEESTKELGQIGATFCSNLLLAVGKPGRAALPLAIEQGGSRSALPRSTSLGRTTLTGGKVLNQVNISTEPTIVGAGMPDNFKIEAFSPLVKGGM